MKIVGKRLWIWMSVWCASVIVTMGPVAAAPQEHPKSPDAESMVSKGHKIPKGTHSKTKSKTFQDDWDQTQGQSGGKTNKPHGDDWESTQVRTVKTNSHKTSTSSHTTANKHLSLKTPK